MVLFDLEFVNYRLNRGVLLKKIKAKCHRPSVYRVSVWQCDNHSNIFGRHINSWYQAKSTLSIDGQIIS